MTEPRPRIRSRRLGWAASEGTKLTKRDVQILYLVGTCGIARTRDVARFFFGARATANDRLRKLYCAGHLECFVPSLAGDNYYALTVLGRDLVCSEHDVEPDALRVVRRLPKKLDHQIAVTDVRLSVAMACMADTRYALAAFETDADLARTRHANLLDLIPDAKIVVETSASGEASSFFLEMDLGSEPTTWLVRHKLAVYARHAALGTVLYGVRDPLVVLVTAGLRRARNVARTLADMNVRARVVFALRAMLDETTVLGAAYALPEDLLQAPLAAHERDLFRRRLLP